MSFSLDLIEWGVCILTRVILTSAPRSIATSSPFFASARPSGLRSVTLMSASASPSGSASRTTSLEMSDGCPFVTVALIVRVVVLVGSAKLRAGSREVAELWR